MEPYDAIVLAGGRASRLGGVHKPAIEIGGRPLLHRVLVAAGDARTRIVVGPPQDVPPGVRIVREDPPGGGPAAAIGAALPLVAAPFVAVLAGDLPFLTTAAVLALRAAAATADGAMALDDGGRDQFLTAVWRTDRLREALPDDPAGASLRRIVAGLELVRVSLPGAPDAPPPWFDCDDQHDVTRAERWARQ